MAYKCSQQVKVTFPFSQKLIRLVNSRYFKKVQKTRTPDFERNRFLSNPVSKFPCQPSLPTPGSLSFPRIPTLASLKIDKHYVFKGDLK